MKELKQNTESTFYQELANAHPVKQTNDLGIGDDGAIIFGNICIVKDLAVEGVHFNLKWSNFKQVVTKALVSNLSDLFSMGATPKYFLCGIVSPELDRDMALYNEVTRFLSEKYSIELIGGDLSFGNTTVVSITAIGEIQGNRLLRSESKVGDSLYLFGRPGLSKWVLDHYLSDNQDEISSQASDYHLESTKCLELGSKVLSMKAISAAMDLSDGFSTTCYEMGYQSKVKFVLYQHLFRYPLEIDHLDEDKKLEYFLSSGEEYFSLVSVPSYVEIPLELSADENFFKVGVVQKGNGVEIHTQNGKICTLDKIGYSHFD